MAIIFGKDPRVRRQLEQSTTDRGRALRSLWITLGHQPGTPPLRQLLNAPTQSAAGRAPPQRSCQTRRCPCFGLRQQSAEPPRHSGGAARTASSRSIGQAVHAFDNESLDPAPHSPGIVADQLRDRCSRMPGGREQDHGGPDRRPTVTHFDFELAAFECRDVGKPGAGTHTDTGIVVVIEVIIDKATASPGQLSPLLTPTGLRTELLLTCVVGTIPGDELDGAGRRTTVAPARDLEGGRRRLSPIVNAPRTGRRKPGARFMDTLAAQPNQQLRRTDVGNGASGPG